MPYVRRNGDGTIGGVYARPQDGLAEEFVSEESAELAAFARRQQEAIDAGARRGAAQARFFDEFLTGTKTVEEIRAALKAELARTDAVAIDGGTRGG